MAAFQVIRRSDIPNAWQVGTHKAEAPKVRLHRGGCLFFSCLATEPFGEVDCKVLCEYDEEQRMLRFTAREKLPRGVNEEDCLPMRIRRHQHARRPIAMVSIRALLNHIGFVQSGKPQDFPVRALDAKAKSITLELPCNGPSAS